MKRLTIALDDAEYEALAARAKAEDRTVRQQAAHEIKAAANHASWPFTWPNTGGFWPWRGGGIPEPRPVEIYSNAPILSGAHYQ